jgi:hypothetical protein
MEKSDAGSHAEPAPADGPRCPLEPVAFTDVVIPWREWVLAWEAGAAQADHPDTPVWAIRFPP